MDTYERNLEQRCDSQEYKIEQLENENEQLKEQLEHEAIISSMRRDEIDQLKAWMAEFQSLVIEGTSQMQWYHSGKKFLGVDYCNAAELINRTPAQSLASIKAQTLREYADKNYVSIAIDDFDRGCNHAMWQMRKDAERIEQEAKE